MDANGARFFLAPLETAGPGLAWDGARRRLRFASAASVRPPADRDAAVAAAERPRGAVDGRGTFAVLDATRSAVLAGGAAPGLVEIFTAPGGETIRDVVIRPDGTLCAALSGGGVHLATPVVEELDPPFAPLTLALEGFAAERLAVGPDGAVWVLERGGRRLAELRGEPLPRLLPFRGTDEGFRPKPREPDPPRLVERPVEVPAGRVARALVADGRGRVILLVWPEAAGESAPAELLVLAVGQSSRIVLQDLFFPFDLGWLGGDRFALAFAGWPTDRLPEAVAVELPADPDATQMAALGEIYPMPGWDGAGLLAGAVTPARYLEGEGDTVGTRPLVALSRPAYPAEARLGPSRFDGGVPGFVWHRLYLEAALPPGTGVTVGLAATDQPDSAEELPPARHRFGTAPVAAGPVGVWLPQASELPFHPGLLGEAPSRDRCGLFSCLAQAPGGPDRALRGRWLEVAISLHGDGRATPELAALRVWGPRFSYRDNYLPRLYRSPVAAGGDSDDERRARLDFLDRYLALFEGVLTPIEDEIASAFRLFAPATAPVGALDWLASWLGLEVPAALPVDHRRRFLREAVGLLRRRGTLAGLARTLDAVTGDLAARGDLVIVEHFRLCRTMATILGARLEPASDPLLPGRLQGGNSVVGRTLFLGAETQREFLALFRPEQLDLAEEEEVLRFLDDFANRITVIVHREVDAETLGLVRQTVASEVPAHVEARVLTASRPLLIGLSSLLAVDTYTRPRPPRAGVVLDATRLGAPAFLADAASLDPRLEGGFA
ncbi:MAG TPA: phage tail protein [Geminicoccaceae bacterium]|nr:phage tail protein [Geminicoccaceae bacterium]